MNGFIDISLDDLALFVSVVETGGFTAAARKTGTPQASISRRIALLEQTMGVRLLDRTTRRVNLTEPGRRVYDRGQIMVQHALAARQLVEEMQQEPMGDLRISASVMLGQAIVANILARYIARFPQVRIAVEWTTRNVHPIEDGVDIAVRIGRLPDSGLAMTRLGTVGNAIFTPDADLARRIRLTSDLAGREIFGLGTDLGDKMLTLRRGEIVENVSVTRRMAANDAAPIIAAAQAVGGIAVLPQLAVPAGWTRLLTDWELPRLEVNAVSAATRGTLPRVRELLSMLRGCLAT